MAHAQKPDFVYRQNGRVYLNQWGASFQSITGSWGVSISGSNAGYTMFRGSVKGTGYPLHSPVSPSLPLACVTVCHHVSTGFYHMYEAYTVQRRTPWQAGHSSPLTVTQRSAGALSSCLTDTASCTVGSPWITTHYWERTEHGDEPTVVCYTASYTVGPGGFAAVVVRPTVFRSVTITTRTLAYLKKENSV